MTCSFILNQAYSGTIAIELETSSLTNKPTHLSYSWLCYRLLQECVHSLSYCSILQWHYCQASTILLYCTREGA